MKKVGGIRSALNQLNQPESKLSIDIYQTERTFILRQLYRKLRLNRFYKKILSISMLKPKGDENEQGV